MEREFSAHFFLTVVPNKQKACFDTTFLDYSGLFFSSRSAKCIKSKFGHYIAK